uniref:Uncharacterized protein n=1 Tax=Glossina pallidipes TaxID=7398 RepID=A0A1B0AH97_GLOPL
MGDDLFDQLKNAGPVKRTPPPTINVNNKKPEVEKVSNNSVNDTIEIEKLNKEHEICKAKNRRKSMPPPVSVNVTKYKSNKSRSMSPPKIVLVNNAPVKSLKVRLERKNLEKFLPQPLEEHVRSLRFKQEKTKESAKTTKTTPTKAQQKLFEPMVMDKAQKIRSMKIKRCLVRLQKVNVKKLQAELDRKVLLSKVEKPKPSKGQSKNLKKKPTESSPTKQHDSPQPKRARQAIIETTKTPQKFSKAGFFIKLTPSLSNKKAKEKKKRTLKLNAAVGTNSSKTSISKPTSKFTRTQLIKTYGKRVFNAYVKIERCTHPLLLTFESNARARKLQAKRNKSKNLSVSFREQVEVFGDSSDSEEYCSDEDFYANLKILDKAGTNNHSTPLVMPARLKKVENGKVIDDIELDPTLFVDPNNLCTTTPFMTPGRKKREHKTLSPLKDDGTPSPRKEQLKLANEKLPPSGLRRINLDEEDDDEDDDCEYIVPTEVPQRRSSYAGLNTSLDDGNSAIIEKANNETPVNSPIAANIDSTTKTIETQPEMHNTGETTDSFESAQDQTEKLDVDLESSNLNTLSSRKSSPIELFNDALSSTQDLLPDKQNNTEESKNDNTDLIANKKSVIEDGFGDIPMKLFVEDSRSDDNPTNAIVDSIINETLNEMKRNINDLAEESFKATTT